MHRKNSLLVVIVVSLLLSNYVSYATDESGNTASSSHRAKVLAPHKPVPPRLPDSLHWDYPPALRSVKGGLWMIDADFKSSIYLRNIIAVAPVTVTPILYLSNGRKITLADVKLEPSGTAVVNVNEALSAKGIAPWATLSGYVEIQYTWPWDAICATVTSVDPVHSLIFTNFLKIASVAGVKPASDPASARQTQIVEGVWWKHEANVTGFVALSNTLDEPVTVRVQASDKEANVIGDHTAKISPHGTKVIDVKELQQATSVEGGIRVSYEGPTDAVVVNGGLKDQSTGYSASMHFAPSVPTSVKVVEADYAELGLMAGATDPMMLFPAGIVFTPYSIVRNVSDQVISVTPTLWWMEGAEPHSARLNEMKLLPYHTQSLNVTSLILAAGLKGFNGSVNLALDYHGPKHGLLMASGSVDQTNSYVFEVLPHGVSEGVAESLGYWSVSNGDDTMIDIWNPADEAQEFVFTVFFSGGHYELPIHLGPRASQMFNLSEVIRNQIPDKDGHVIPATVREGSAQISGSQGVAEHILVAISVGIYNVRKATCHVTCQTCQGAVGAPVLADSPFITTVSGSHQLTSTVTNHDGSKHNYTTLSAWTSHAPSVATIGSATGLVSGVAAGGVMVDGYIDSLLMYGQVCGEPPNCGDNVVSQDPTDNGSVTPKITSITPSTGQAGTTALPVTIRGIGFGAAGTVGFGGTGITVAYVTRNDTTIAGTFTIASNAPVGSQNVTVTNSVANMTSAPVSFDVTACAVPVNIQQTSCSDNGNGDLHFNYSFSSSTGNPGDLSSCTVGEIVTYPGSVDPFPFPSPPFPADAYSNPTIGDFSATSGTFTDDHFLTPSTTFVKPYSASSFTATQYYRYKCSCANGGNYVNMVGPLSIVRSVSQNSNATWKFTVTKSSCSAQINPLP